MARYKDVCYEQDKFIPVYFAKQIVPGSFEYTLSYLIDHELDLSVFDASHKNGETGAPAFDPSVLMKIVIYAYSRGITSSRKIEQACRDNIMFMALSADTQALGLSRLSLRTKRKVDIQWKLYCLVHNLLNIHRYGDLGLT